MRQGNVQGKTSVSLHSKEMDQADMLAQSMQSRVPSGEAVRWRTAWRMSYNP